MAPLLKFILSVLELFLSHVSSSRQEHECLFNTCLLSTYYMPGFVLGTKNTAVNKTEQNPCPFKAYILAYILVTTIEGVQVSPKE